MSSDTRKLACIFGVPCDEPVQTWETESEVARSYIDFSEMFTSIRIPPRPYGRGFLRIEVNDKSGTTCQVQVEVTHRQHQFRDVILRGRQPH